jgi:hypothetical protein
MRKNNPQFERENPGITFEPRDMRVNNIIIIGLGLLAVILLSLFISFKTYHHFLAQVRRQEALGILSPLRAGRPAPLPPEPRLQGAPGHPTLGPEELQSVLQAADQQLNSYGWVNQQAGIAHIPVRDAMRLIAEKGLPSVPPVSTAPAKAPSLSPLAKPAKGAKP